MITVNRKQLVRLVDMAASVAPRRAAIPILGCARLRVESGQLVVQATDLETSLAGEIPCDGSDGDLGIVPAPQLLALLRGIESERIGLDGANERVRVVFEAGAVSLASFAAVDWPDVVKAGQPNGATMVPGDALARMTRVLYAACTDPTRLQLAGVVSKDGEFVAIDGHRLAKVPGLRIEPFAISLGSVRIIATGYGDADEVAVEVTDDAISVRRPGLRVSARIRRNDFPPYGPICTAALDGSPIVVPREELLSAVALLGAVGAARLMLVAGERLRIRPIGADGPEGEIEVPIRSGHVPDVEIGLDQRYAEQAVAQMEGDDLTLHLSPGTMGPIAFRDGSGNVAVVAPIRI